MAIINAQKFSANIRNLRKLDDTLRAVISESVAYAAWHFHTGSANKTPFLTLTSTHPDKSAHLNANLPGWLTAALRKEFKLPAKADKAFRESDATATGDMVAALVMDAEAQKRAAKAVARKAKAEAAPKAAPADPQPANTAAPESNAAPQHEAAVVEGECKVVQELESALIIGGEVMQISAAEADALYDTLMALRSAMMQRPRLVA